MAADKRVALELAIKLQRGDITIEDLTEQIEQAKKEMAEMEDTGSDAFMALSQVVETNEKALESMNEQVNKSKKGFEDTSKAQKEAGQSSNIFAKGIKAIGTGLKALGIGIVLGAIKLFYDAISKNQKIMDALSTALGTIGILFEKVFNVIFNVVDTVNKASNGFSGLTAVIKGLLTLSLTPLKLVFSSIVLTIKQAQLAWEQSFFGGKDEEKIKQLTKDVKDTQKEIQETGKEALKAGKSVVENFSAAVSEVGQVVGGAVKGIQEINVKGAYEQAEAQTQLKNSAEVAAAQQQLLLEEYDRQAEKLRQVRDEERNSIDDRIKANNELGDVLDKQEEAMLKLADAQIASAQANFEANKRTENEVALIQALANKKAIEAQIEGFRSEQKINNLGLDRENVEMIQSLSDSEAKLSFERKRYNAEQIEDKLESLKELKKIAQEEAHDEMLRLERVVFNAEMGTQAEIDALKALDEFKEASRQANIDADKAIAEEEKKLADDRAKRLEENKEALKQQATELLNSLVDFSIASSKAEEARLQDMINNTEEGTEARKKAEAALEKQKEKSFKMEQQAAIGRTLISTAQGAMQAYNSQIIPLDPTSIVRGALAAALVTSAGLAQIATIKKQKFYGSGGAGISPPSQPSLGGGDVGTQPRGFTTPTVDTDVQTTKVIVTETDIRNVSRNVDGVYSRATVVQ
jgi:hypothetical protein